MKHALTALLFLIVLTLRNNTTNAQCLNSTSFNGSLNFSSSTTSIPNNMAPTGWSKNDSPDQAKAGIPIDCANIPLVASANGGTWTRMADKVTSQEGIYRDISGFTVGTYYEFSFEQSLVKNWGRSSGSVTVTMGTTSRNSPTIALPTANVAQASWRSVTVGPFLATSTTMTVTFSAHSNQDGSGSSPMSGSCSSYSQNALAADLMIDGISICPTTVLPLNFISFDITAPSSVHTLNWTIADTENELDKFIIMNSNDLVSWNTIGSVSKQSNTMSYSFPVEFCNVSKENYYKVSACNNNKVVLATTPILLSEKNNAGAGCNWTYHPDLNEYKTSPSAKNRAAVVYDSKGNTICEYFFTSNSEPTIKVDHLSQGLYIVLTSDGTQNYSFKFIK